MLATAENPTVRWSQWQRIGFRFAGTYLLLYTLPFLLGMMPGIDAWWWNTADKPWLMLARWVGSHILHLRTEVTPFQDGSADTTYGYVRVVCTLGVSIGVTAVWSFLDRRRTDDLTAHDWLRFLLRYNLGTTLLLYGIVKVIKVQFPFPLARLVQTFGESSPAGLLWSFMGISTAYTFFGGAMELLAGALLLFRRTTTLGALVACGVLANVVMLNLSYDVPIKLYSSHLLAMTVLLVIPDLKRLANVFLFNRPCEPARLDGPKFKQLWMNRTFVAVQILVMGTVVVSNVVESVERYRKQHDIPSSGLYGIYEVETFVRNGETIPPLLTERTRWRWVTVQGSLLSITSVEGSGERYRSKHDQDKQQLTLSPTTDPDIEYVLSYTKTDDGRFTFRGIFKNDAVAATVRRVDESQFLLVNRGFHWINERFLNR
ncbi:hypothetical protein LZC95_48450 [Pendulispora brunnea]|uniref:DoxX family protein n=1 Tax=Pendulispora brunnea TaxID=2905690 RepID=A0ABZ2KD07_9BACT